MWWRGWLCLDPPPHPPLRHHIAWFALPCRRNHPALILVKSLKRCFVHYGSNPTWHQHTEPSGRCVVGSHRPTLKRSLGSRDDNASEPRYQELRVEHFLYCSCFDCSADKHRGCDSISIVVLVISILRVWFGLSWDESCRRTWNIETFSHKWLIWLYRHTMNRSSQSWLFLIKTHEVTIKHEYEGYTRGETHSSHETLLLMMWSLLKSWSIKYLPATPSYRTFMLTVNYYYYYLVIINYYYYNYNWFSYPVSQHFKVSEVNWDACRRAGRVGSG